jgi:hypothetical protein
MRARQARPTMGACTWGVHLGRAPGACTGGVHLGRAPGACTANRRPTRRLTRAPRPAPYSASSRRARRRSGPGCRGSRRARRRRRSGIWTPPARTSCAAASGSTTENGRGRSGIRGGKPRHVAWGVSASRARSWFRGFVVSPDASQLPRLGRVRLNARGSGPVPGVQVFAATVSEQAGHGSVARVGVRPGGAGAGGSNP